MHSKTTPKRRTLQKVDIVHLKALEARLDRVEDVLRDKVRSPHEYMRDETLRTLRFRPFWLITPSSSGFLPMAAKFIPYSFMIGL